MEDKNDSIDKPEGIKESSAEEEILSLYEDLGDEKDSSGAKSFGQGRKAGKSSGPLFFLDNEGGLMGDRSREGAHHHWSVPWSDLMMTMFVFFAVLLTYMLSERDMLDAFAKDVEKTDEPAIEEPLEGLDVFNPSPERIFKISQEIVRETDLENVEVVMNDDKSVKVSVRGPMMFDLGSAKLRPQTKGFLKKIAGVLKKTRNEIHVVGHTDNFPIHTDKYPTNWELSVARASGVARYLIEQGGLVPGRFTVMGNSYYRPAELNIRSKDKARNRRVEIIITREIYKSSPKG